MDKDGARWSAYSTTSHCNQHSVDNGLNIFALRYNWFCPTSLSLSHQMTDEMFINANNIQTVFQMTFKKFKL